MTTAVAASLTPILQFFANNGQLMAGGSVLTQVSGVNAPTYQDSGGTTPLPNPIPLNSRGEISNASGASCQLFLPVNTIYTFTFMDASGNIIWTATYCSSLALSQSIIGQTLFPQTPAESTAGITPTNYYYLPLDPRRYASLAQWTQVYNSVSNLTATYDVWYRADRAQHPSLTNTIVGYQAYNDCQLTGTIGYRCTAFGVETLQQNKQSTNAGGSNCAFGVGSLQNNIEGSGNCGFGALTLNALPGTVGGVGFSHNNAFGYRVLSALVNGVQNNCFGFEVTNSLLIGNNNHGFGESTLFSLLYGNGNTAFGYQGLYSKTAGDFSISLGYDALFSENAQPIVSITIAANAVITISTVSTINPYEVGAPIEVVNAAGMTQINGLFGQVTAIGGSSGAWTVTTTINSTGFSAYTGAGYLAPLGNIALGYRAGFNVSARGGNILTGFQTAGDGAEPGAGNVTYGYQAGQALNCNAGGGTADFNCLIGFQAGLRMTGGNSNVVMGPQAGNFITTGVNSVVIGANAGQAVTTTSQNTWVGALSGINLNGNNNTGLGYNAGVQVSAQTYTNTTSLGANAIPGQNGDFTLGDVNVTRLRCQQTSITAISDARFKKNIEPLDIPDGFLDEVQIVVYEWITEGMPQGPQVGVIAQQLDEIQTKYGCEWLGLVSKTNPDRWEATPGKLLFLLIQRVQRQEQRLQRIEALLAL
jgi:hypothetical protein